jgi:hypothetical protein
MSITSPCPYLRKMHPNILAHNNPSMLSIFSSFQTPVNFYNILALRISSAYNYIYILI